MNQIYNPIQDNHLIDDLMHYYLQNHKIIHQPHHHYLNIRLNHLNLKL
jgi:hypothetical protein